MIKYLAGLIIILALIGGAVEFKSTDQDYSLVMNKEVAKGSVYKGVINIYDFVKELIDNSTQTSTTNEKINQVEKVK